MKISVICPAEIAYRRFLPALLKSNYFEFAGVGYHSTDEIIYCNEGSKEQKLAISRDKALKIITKFGGKLYESYNSVVNDTDVNCIYIPLPPRLHFDYAKKSLLNHKNVLIEKPATMRYREMEELVDIAKSNNSVIHENYMFTYHSQLMTIQDIVKSGDIGEVRLYRISYGFPFRGENDFRYNKSLGGGALLDAGVYTIKLSTILLGNDCHIDSANLCYLDRFSADIYGQGVVINDKGISAQISFGIDNDYKCELEIWGSKGTLFTNRVFTAPVGYAPIITIRKNGVENKIELNEDDSFYNSIEYFGKCIGDEIRRYNHYNELLIQSRLVEEFYEKAKIHGKECDCRS